MSTLATLLQALAAARRSGVDFDAAWEAASAEALGASCDAGDWAPVLDATQAAWHRSYERLPAAPAERALSLLGWDAELVDVGHVCARCGVGIPPARCRRAPAVYCTDGCRRAWHRERERIAA